MILGLACKMMQPIMGSAQISSKCEQLVAQAVS